MKLLILFIIVFVLSAVGEILSLIYLNGLNLALVLGMLVLFDLFLLIALWVSVIDRKTSGY